MWNIAKEMALSLYYKQEQLAAALHTHIMGRSLTVVDEVDSTNTYLKREYAALPHGHCVVSACQTQGKGSKGRVWRSPMGDSVAFSVLWKPQTFFDYSMLTLCCGLAVCLAIRELTGLDARIKWPNDVVVQEKKVCGILCENIFDSGKPSLILGIGINLLAQQEYFDQMELPYGASLAMLGANPQAEKLVARVLDHLERLCLDTERDGDLTACLEQWRPLCVTLGQSVRVIQPGEEFSGMAVDVDNCGHLLVDDGNKLHTLIGAEVSVRGLYGYV